MREWDKLKEYQEHKALFATIEESDTELRSYYQGLLDREREELLKRDEIALVGVLDNPRIKELLEMAGNAGLLKGREWLGTKECLAYFVERMCQECKIWYNNIEGNIYWKPFQDWFMVSGLKDAKQSYLKVYTTFAPNGSDEIDRLFTYQLTI